MTVTRPGIIKAGLAPDPDGNYEDEGLLALMADNVDVATFATQALTYDVQNQSGTNPVWARIRLDNEKQYQFIPTPYGVGWNTISGCWPVAAEWTFLAETGSGLGCR